MGPRARIESFSSTTSSEQNHPHHKFHPSILRANDIRGIVNKTLFPHDALIIGKCIGTILLSSPSSSSSILNNDNNNNNNDNNNTPPTIIIGRDGRLTSPLLYDNLITGLLSTGLHVTAVGCGPTPMIYFTEKFLNADAAVMVTGSHNPPGYNGFKISLGGRALFDEDIKRFDAVASQGAFVEGVGELRVVDVMEDYISYIMTDYVTHYNQQRKGRPLRVAWDCGNGAVSDIVSSLASRLPGHHILLNNTIDGRFPAHHPDPTVAKNLVQLINVVTNEQCDVGVAFDGDGDRIGVVDGEGGVLYADQLLLFYAEEILSNSSSDDAVSSSERRVPIIADVKASQTLFDEVERRGGQAIMCRTGHSLIKHMMREHEAPLAGEMSGHIFFADRFMGFDDAVYAALRLVGRLGTLDRSLVEWRGCVPQSINTPEIRLACGEERKWGVVSEVMERVKRRGDARECMDLDGLRVVYDDGWWLLRASNTESALVVRVEANDDVSFERLKVHLMKELEESGVELSI